MDFEAMAREMARLGKDFEVRRKMGNIGYERTKRNYTYEQFLERYREIYERYI
jgi:glycosyltransferase involved in cell wall biosynthesis